MFLSEKQTAMSLYTNMTRKFCNKKFLTMKKNCLICCTCDCQCLYLSMVESMFPSCPYLEKTKFLKNLFSCIKAYHYKMFKASNL